MKTFLAFLLSSISFAFAGNEIGNGGNYVQDVCLKKVSFYDAYEMEKLLGWEIKLPAAEENEIEIAKGFAQRLEYFNTDDSIKLLNLWISNFYKDTDFQNEPLALLTDFKSRVIEEGSTFHQLIIQKRGRYKIYKPIWDRMDKVQKAVAILHEVIYRRSLMNNPFLDKSDAVRLLVQILIADKIQDNWITITILVDSVIEQRPVIYNEFDFFDPAPVVVKIPRKNCRLLQN